MNVKIITDCAEVVTLTETKNWLKVTGTQDDDLIEDIMIPAARQALEKFTGASFGEKTIEVLFTTWENFYTLPYGPVTEVTKVERVYTDGTETELTTDDYTVRDDKVYVTEWYSTRELVGVRVTYTAGYNDDEPMPAMLKEAVLNQISYNYDNRENGGISPAAMHKCQPYKRFWV